MSVRRTRRLSGPISETMICAPTGLKPRIEVMRWLRFERAQGSPPFARRPWRWWLKDAQSGGDQDAAGPMVLGQPPPKGLAEVLKEMPNPPIGKARLTGLVSQAIRAARMAHPLVPIRPESAEFHFGVGLFDCRPRSTGSGAHCFRFRVRSRLRISWAWVFDTMLARPCARSSARDIASFSWSEAGSSQAWHQRKSAII